jgi:large subunit ribosomal protein L23
MAISDIFKKEDAKAAKPKAEKTASIQTKNAVKPASRTGREGLLLMHAHVTEKSSKLAEENKYVFKVVVTANKQGVARAVESYYGVLVENVHVINVPPKRRRRGRGFATKPGYRKAIVQLKKGQTIEVMPK